MDSKRKRDKKHHVEEKLIEKSSHHEEDKSTVSDIRRLSETPELREDMIIDTQNEETIDNALEKPKDKGCFGCVYNETVRLYVITISTFIFAFLSIAFGIFLLVSKIKQFHSLRGGIIAIVIGLVLFVPACYGMTRIISKKVKKRKSKSNKSPKDEPAGLTVSSLIDV